MTFDVEVRPGAETRVRYAMPRLGRLLDTVVVTARELPRHRREFEWRRRTGMGTYFTRADIDRADPHQLTDRLRRVPAVHVRTDDRGDLRAFSCRAFGHPCEYRVVLDGNPLRAGTLANFITPKDLSAVEIYHGLATMPPEYRPSGGTFATACGVILLWTRYGN